jgi:hypothetical protein
VEGVKRVEWKRLLAYITGSVDQELLLRNEYLVTENRMLRQQIRGRMRLTDAERQTLAELGKKLGRHALEEVDSIVTPDTLLAWHRKFVAQKFDGSQQRKPPGRPPVACGVGGVGRPYGAGESLLGVRSHCRRLAASGLHYQ